MSIVNRRNAVLGWIVWQTGKRVAKRKAKSVVPTTGDGASVGKKKPAIAALIAAAAGTAMFWRRRSAREEAEAPAEETPVE